jgi:alkyldihydroxyacetonephosphate synthase
VTADGSVIDTLPFARHAAGPELTQLFVGSEGTLGVITRVTVKLVPSPAIRRFAALSLPALEAGIAAMRGVLQSGIRPSVVRLYDADATRGSLARVIDEPLDGPALLLVFEGEQEVADAEAETTLRALRGHGATELDPALCESWWDQRYAFYHPPQAPKLPQMWATIDAVADYTHILGVYHELRQALEPFGEVGLTLKTHFSHWYAWGTMVYPRFIVPDISSHPDPPKLYAAIWDAGVDAILRAGGVMNDHHGVGSTLAPYVARQWGAAYRPLLAIKSALDPANVLNPGKLGFPLRAVTGPVPA